MNNGVRWQKQHRAAIVSFLKYLNSQTADYILKGGTALLVCYGLDRFSEDVDLDGMSTNIGSIVSEYCDKRGYFFRTVKDTDTVKRYMVNYGDAKKPLKIEVSFRKKDISENEYTNIKGITVYTIESLCVMKANAYSARDRIRDLYDLTFICKTWWGEISDTAKIFVRNAVEYKGIAQFDYMTQTQADDLIDKDKLADDFLNMYDKLGLMYDEKEKLIIDAAVQHTAEKKRE
jgi:predicted nucleotidyltransferase component of viral defense system